MLTISMTDFRQGIKVTSVLVTIGAAVTPTLVHPIPYGRSAHIRKIRWCELSGLGGLLQIGHGAGGTWVKDLPDIVALASLDGILQELDIPNEEFYSSPVGLTTLDIYARTTVSTSMAIQVEVEEFGA